LGIEEDLKTEVEQYMERLKEEKLIEMWDFYYYYIEALYLSAYFLFLRKSKINAFN
jgi:hypothetical protein